MRRFGLLPMAASGLVGMLDQTEYVSVIWVTAAIGSAFTAGHFWKRAPKVTMGLSPGSVRHEAGYPVFCLKLFAYSFGERYPRAECSRLLL